MYAKFVAFNIEKELYLKNDYIHHNLYYWIHTRGIRNGIDDDGVDGVVVVVVVVVVVCAHLVQ